MKRKLTLFIAAAALAAAALVAAAFGDTSSAATPQASKGAVVGLRQTALGKVLVDTRGRTLYLFEKDTQGRSACYGACAAYWPPLFSSAKPRAGKGVHASLLGATRRTDGKRQVTYAGHPLYTFVGDTKAGQTTGEGLNNFGAAWDVVAASGRAVEPTASDSTGSGQTGGGYGYGYVVGAANAQTQADVYSVRALVSDSAAAPAADASLVNGWGLSAGPATPWWAANNGTNTATLYNGVGAKQALTVTVAGGPTGTAFNGSASDFVVTQDGKSGAARFLFATEGGTIMGWSPTVNATAAVAPGRAQSTGASRLRTTSCTRRTSTTDESTCSTSRSTSSRAVSAIRGSRRAMRRSESRRSGATSS
jgi:predicted lipoprotein with Yx(FWY)xxD motif